MIKLLFRQLAAEEFHAMQIAIVAFDDFTDLDLVLHWDLLSRVHYIGGIKDRKVRILGTKPSHISTLGLRISTSGLVEQASEADGVMAPASARS